MQNACAVLNFAIDDVLDNNVLSYFQFSFLQITDQTAFIAQLQQSKQKSHGSHLHRHLKHAYVLKNVQNLRSEPSFGLTLNQPCSTTNACLIKLLNMLAQLDANLEQLRFALSDELCQISQVIIQDLNSNGGLIMDVEQLDGATGLPAEEKYFAAIGFGKILFQTTLQRLKDES